MLGGSFVTNKAKPKDIDILVEGTPLIEPALRLEPRLGRLFDHDFTRRYGVQAKPWNPQAPVNLLVLWQTPSDEDIRERGVLPDEEKGVLQVRL